jgi:hypothetical protein
VTGQLAVRALVDAHAGRRDVLPAGALTTAAAPKSLVGRSKRLSVTRVAIVGAGIGGLTVARPGAA